MTCCMPKSSQKPDSKNLMGNSSVYSRRLSGTFSQLFESSIKNVDRLLSLQIPQTIRTRSRLGLATCQAIPGSFTSHSAALERTLVYVPVGMLCWHRLQCDLQHSSRFCIGTQGARSNACFSQAPSTCACEPYKFHTCANCTAVLTWSCSSRFPSTADMYSSLLLSSSNLCMPQPFCQSSQNMWWQGCCCLFPR